MNDNAIVLRSDAIQTMDDVERAANAMSKSGYFQDARDVSQAIVKILAGREMGFGAFASMTGVYIIQGRPSIGANLMAAAVKSSGRYNYRVIEMTDAACEITYFERGQECGNSRFTIEDARKAGTKNLDKFPRNMLFARAMSNGCRWYCPDVFAGAPTYTPEEMGAEVNESGEVIDVPAVVVQPSPNGHKPTPPPEPEPAPEPVATMSLEMAETELTSDKPPRKYGDLTSEELANRDIGIKKALKSELDTDKIATYQRKHDAIATILASRAANP